MTNFDEFLTTGTENSNCTSKFLDYYEMKGQIIVCHLSEPWKNKTLNFGKITLSYPPT